MVSRRQTLADRILVKALELGEGSSWDAVRLYAVAEALDISQDQVRELYPQKDDLVEAWFDRADRAVLGAKVSEAFLVLSARERLQQVIMAWLEGLAPHRRLTREMLAYKLEFGHVHLQVLGIMRVSRTVQWFLEAAREDSEGLERIFDESVVSTVYLLSFARWLYDDSPESRRTREFLDARLRQWERLGGGFARCLKGRRGGRQPDRRPQSPLEDSEPSGS